MKHLPKNLRNLIEELADIEHQQWIHWSQSVAENIPFPLRSKWQKSWIPYPELNEELKEMDRVWARKVLALLQKHKLIS